MSGGGSRRQTLAICGLLLLAVGLVFGHTIRYEFVNYDDDKYVYENPPVLHGLSVQGTAWAFTQRTLFWGPLTWLSLMLDSQLYGRNAGGFHLTNVVLHAATAVLLFLVLRRMTGRVWPSALVAALFAVHPLRAESVAWVTERKDVLSGLFFMLTLGAYVGYVRHRFSFVRYLAVTVFLLLGLMAKPMLVTLPFVLLLLDYWPLRRMSNGACPNPMPLRCNRGDFASGADFPKTQLGRFSFPWRALLEKVPLLLLIAVCGVWFVSAQTNMLGSVEAFPLGWRIGHALVAYVAYLGQSFYPLGLAAVYPRSGLALPAWKSVAAFLLLLGITAAALVWWRRRPYLLVGWLWFLGMLLPVIGLVQFGAQAMADRFTYLPQIGLCIVLAWGLDEVCRSSVYRRWIGGVASVLVVGVLMGCAWRQTSFWRDNESLWTHTLACTSRNVLAHYDLGLALAGQGRLDEALTQYRQALEVQPRYADAHNNMAIILVGQGRFDEARVHYQKALAINPDSAEIHNNLAYALACYGRFGEATAHYRKALELDPRCAMAHAKYGVILALQGQTAEALAHYQRALQVDPNYLEVHVKLAWLLATCPEASLRNGPAAIEHARWVDRLYGGREPAVLDVLAAAYAAAGRFPEALLTARQGLELATQKNNRALANTLRARIAWYEAGKPFCQPLPPSAKREP